MKQRYYLPLAGLFVAVFSIASLSGVYLRQQGIDSTVLIVANIILFFVSAVSLYFHIKGFLHKNVQVFLRSVYASLLIKMFVCAGAVVVYAFAAKQHTNKGALLISMALYILYTGIEIRQVFRLLKQKQKHE